MYLGLMAVSGGSFAHYKFSSICQSAAYQLRSTCFRDLRSLIGSSLATYLHFQKWTVPVPNKTGIIVLYIRFVHDWAGIPKSHTRLQKRFNGQSGT